MRHLALVAAMVVGVSGCANVYHHVDTAQNGTTASFRGIADYLQDGHALYVIQVHGMGDHSHKTDCTAGSDNLKLQDKIVGRLHYPSEPEYADPEPQPIKLSETQKQVGTYSVRKFKGSTRMGDLYFSCVTWGEMARLVKQGILELNDDYLENNENERHRALINRLR